MNKKGFSLVQVMVVAGIMGGLSLVMMKTIDNLNSGTRQMNTFEDELEFKRSINQFLTDPDLCRISIAGEGEPGSPIEPTVFLKTNTNEKIDTKGIDIEFFTPDETLRKRKTKIYSAIDESYNQYKSITINSMKLYFLNDASSDYAPSSLHKDIAKLVIKYSKKTNATSARGKIFERDVLLNLKTDRQLETTILTCGPRYDFRVAAKFYYDERDKIEVSSFFGKEAMCPDELISNAACSSVGTSNCSASASKLECYQPIGEIKRDMKSKMMIPGGLGRFMKCPPFHNLSGFCTGKKNSLCRMYNEKIEVGFYIRCSPLKVAEHVKGSFETYEDLVTDDRFDTLTCPEGSYLSGICTSPKFMEKSCMGNYKAIRCARIIN